MVAEDEAPEPVGSAEKAPTWVEVPRKPVEKPVDTPVLSEAKAPEPTTERPVVTPEVKKPKETTIRKPAEPEPPKREDPSSGTLVFEKHILPIFEARCVKCHGAGKRKGGVDVRTVTSLVSGGGDHGGPLVRGSTEKSRLWKVIASGKMPAAGPKLTDDEKELIRRWIITGAHNTRTLP
jgi:hypothetical protein